MVVVQQRGEAHTVCVFWFVGVVLGGCGGRRG